MKGFQKSSKITLHAKWLDNFHYEWCKQGVDNVFLYIKSPNHRNKILHEILFDKLIYLAGISKNRRKPENGIKPTLFHQKTVS